MKNCYPQGTITFTINDHVSNGNINKPNNTVQATVLKKDILILLPYIGLHGNQPTKRLKSCVYNLYSSWIEDHIPHYHTPHQILFSIQRPLRNAKFCIKMRWNTMFIAALCVIFLIKLRWPKKKILYNKKRPRHQGLLHYSKLKIPWGWGWV